LLSPFSEDSKNPVRQYKHLASKGGYNDELTTVTSVADGDSGWCMKRATREGENGGVRTATELGSKTAAEPTAGERIG